MRISDWSSDVCSSDLPHVARVEILPRLAVDPELNPQRVRIGNLVGGHDPGSDRCEAVVRLVEQTVREMIEPEDRKSVVEGKSVSVRVELGGRRIIKKKTITIVIKYLL